MRPLSRSSGGIIIQRNTGVPRVSRRRGIRSGLFVSRPEFLAVPLQRSSELAPRFDRGGVPCQVPSPPPAVGTPMGPLVVPEPPPPVVDEAVPPGYLGHLTAEQSRTLTWLLSGAFSGPSRPSRWVGEANPPPRGFVAQRKHHFCCLLRITHLGCNHAEEQKAA